jgi:MOSC domain-containing protein
MGGESPPVVVVDERGMQGDRWYAVTDREGRLACGKNSRRFRRRDAVFDWAARTVDDGVVVRGPAGEWPVGDPALDLALSEAMGEEVRVQAEADAAFGHQDGGQVSLVGTASLAWCRDVLRVDADPRRLRVNVVVETDEPFEEESWIGSALLIGAVVLRPVEQVERCRTIDLAQDGVTSTTPWLNALGGSRDVCLGVYADVVTPGRIQVDELLAVT